MMEQLSGNNAGQGDTPAATPAASLGRTLREARERLGLSVADVSGQIKLAVRQIEALEADDFRHLPEMPFVRGFVRSYAKVLQLDAESLLALLPQAHADTVQLVPASVEVPFPSAHSPQRQNLIWLGAALLLSVLVVAFAVWHFTTPVAAPEVAKAETPVPLPEKMQVIPASPVAETEIIAPPAAKVAKPLAETMPAPVVKAARPSVESAHSSIPPAKTVRPPLEPAQPAAAKPTVMQVAPQPQPVKPADQAGAPPQDAMLHLTFEGESWVEIKGKDGKILSSQVNQRGSELRLNGRAPFSLVIANAPSVRLYYRGKPVDLKPHIKPSSDVARLTLE